MELHEGTPAAAGLDSGRLDRAYSLLARWARDGRVAGSAVAVARNGVMVPTRGFGVCADAAGTGTVAVAPDSVFLVASVTKPVTATALMLLVERGLVALGDRVRDWVPEFAGDERDEVLLLHLLTHTSGLPDMLPENVSLRQRHAPLSAFIEGTCRCRLLFRPGTQVRYQSMGIALAGEIVARVSGTPLGEFVAREICAPLGMRSTALGIRTDLLPRLAAVRLPAEQENTDWHWNTPYWRELGAPWGGMFATVEDLLILLQTFLDGGTYAGRRLLGRNTTAAMIADQTSRLPA